MSNTKLRDEILYNARKKALLERIERDAEQVRQERARYLDVLEKMRTIPTPDGKGADLFKQVERAAEESSSAAELKAFNDARSALSGLLADLILFAEAGIVRKKMILNDVSNTIADNFKALKSMYEDEKSDANINKMDVILPKLQASIYLDEKTNILSVEGLAFDDNDIIKDAEIKDAINKTFKQLVEKWLGENGYTGTGKDMQFINTKDKSVLTNTALNNLYVNGNPTLSEFVQLDIEVNRDEYPSFTP